MNLTLLKKGIKIDLYDYKKEFEKHFIKFGQENKDRILGKLERILNDEAAPPFAKERFTRLKGDSQQDIWEIKIRIEKINYRYYSYYKWGGKIILILKVRKKERKNDIKPEEIKRLNQLGKKLLDDLLRGIK
jgi:hypothetical protein